MAVPTSRKRSKLRSLIPVLALALLVFWLTPTLNRQQRSKSANNTASKADGVPTHDMVLLQSPVNSGEPLLPSNPPVPDRHSLPARPPDDSNTMNKLCLVLTTRTADQEGFPRVPNLLESIIKFFEPSMIHTVFILVPDVDGLYIRNAVGALKRFASLMRFDIQVITDSQLLTHPQRQYVQLTPPAENAPGGRGTNYRKQMLLKLAIAAHVPTEFYITLDSDVVVRKEVKFDDLVVQGKAIYQGETSSNSRHREGWWQSAKDVFKTACQTSDYIGVTPAILSATISKGLMKDIVELHSTASLLGGPQTWDLLLFSMLLRHSDWTEYTLYWTYACKAGLISKFHTLSPTGLKLYDYIGFDYGSYQNWKPDQVFTGNADSVFSVLQSISGVAPSVVSALVAPYLSIKD